MRRRSFLAFAALAGLGLAGCGTSSRGNVDTLGFANRLRIPPLLEPTVDADGTKRFALSMGTARAEFLSGRPTTTWGFNGTYLGPTIRATRGERVAMAVTNRLGEASTVHWHGMRLPAVMDGGPHQMIEPGATWSPQWTIDQPAATSWYHPHPHGNTALHVYRGLAGLFLVDDPHSRALPLPSTYGVDDIPLIVQDRKFGEDGSLVEDMGGTFGFLGARILVNGTYDPYLEVTTTRVRLRILNGSNARMYHIGFTDNRKFHVVGTDAGLLPSPVLVDRVRLSPGERAEIVVEFAAREQAVLRSFGGDVDIEEGEFDLLKVIAGNLLTPSPSLPARLSDIPPIEPVAGARVRRFTLGGSNINSKEMDMARIDEVVPSGAREIWEIDNITYAHNFHIHEVAFRVLDVDGEAPPEYMRGPKDTVYVAGKTTVRLAVEFGHHTDPRTPYMYHCHILRHEDKGMMGQFVIVQPGTEERVPRTIDVSGGGHHHGN